MLVKAWFCDEEMPFEFRLVFGGLFCVLDVDPDAEVYKTFS